jgi:hypothetical protein
VTEAILSRLGHPQGQFPWEMVLILVLLVIAYGVVEYAFRLGLRKMWRLLTRQKGE